MKTVCAWCRKTLSGRRDDPDVSHGSCVSCSARMLGDGPLVLYHRESGERTADWIDRALHLYRLREGLDANYIAAHPTQWRMVRRLVRHKLGDSITVRASRTLRVDEIALMWRRDEV